MADQKQITFTLNGRQIVTPAGTLVIEAAKTQGIEVPSFCYYPGLSLQAACRMCLVEVEKMPKLQTACTLVATDGMVVKSDTEQVHKARKDMIEFLLSNHPLDCPGVRQGRRVRTAGHDFPLRPRQHPLRRRKAALPGRKVVAAGLLRCSALHSVLPLRARVR